MKSVKEIQGDIKAIKIKLEQHKANYDKFDWERQGGQLFLNAEKTKTYMEAWINALEWVLNTGD